MENESEDVEADFAEAVNVVSGLTQRWMREHGCSADCALNNALILYVHEHPHEVEKF